MFDRATVPDASACISRRAVLAAVGASMFGLGGCAADPPNAQPNDSSSADAGQTAAPAPAVSPSSAAPRALTTTTAVPVGGGKVVAGILIVQPAVGQFAAFDVRCPHMGARVSPPRAGVITCFEHGSTFRDIDGGLLSGPAPRGLKKIPIAVEGETVVTA
jgi:Rieske Fe-S protein